MDIKKSASSGTLESSDILITVEPNAAQTIDLTLESDVEKQFGKQIRHVILQTLQKLQVTSATVTAVDKGALDCTIQARTLTAVYRAAEKEMTDWKEVATWNA